MDNQRLLIWAFFGLMAWFTYQTWQQDYAPRPIPQPAAETAQDLGFPDETTVDSDELPALDATSQTTQPDELDAPALAEAPPPVETASPGDPVIEVTTDVLALEINLRGGTLQSATMLNYPVAKDDPDNLVTLLSLGEADYGLLRTGLRALGDGEEPNHTASFSSASTRYDIGGADELIVPLRWQNEDGIEVTKRFRFQRGKYGFTIEQALTNNSDVPWRGADYSQIRRYSREQERSMFDVDSYSFDGPIVYDGEKSEKLDRDDLQESPLTFETQNGWYGSIEHHFLSAVVPNRETPQQYRVTVRDNRSTASAIGKTQTVAPGATQVFATTAFVGPKLQEQLAGIDKSLKLTVDYGFLTLLSEPMFIVLSFIHDYVGNWGVAIILMTLLIKLVFYKLTESSGRSMAKMRALQPRMKALQDRYKDDRQALSQAMMDLYKREKVNPAAGCLPILIQMPFFLAFYWVLLESVEMRQAPFALWITDLSTRDPYFILPLIMGAAMLFQQKLNPAPADPVQAKVMQIMPIMFTVFFAFFPSGLVLYWVTNTLLSIAQQWKINRVVEAEEKKRRKN